MVTVRFLSFVILSLVIGACQRVEIQKGDDDEACYDTGHASNLCVIVDGDQLVPVTTSPLSSENSGKTRADSSPSDSSPSVSSPSVSSPSDSDDRNGDRSESDDDCPTLTCGPGTVDVNGECLALDPIVCGPGCELLVDGQCLPDSPLICGAGTVEIDGECVPEIVCGPGTVLEDGECVPLCTPTFRTLPKRARPVDVVVAINESDSAAATTHTAVTHLPGFATVLAGADPRIVLIASSDACINAPFGSGDCSNDENLPGYRHVISRGSSDLLEKILQTHSEWAPSLRADARKVFIVLNDDNDRLSATAFDAQLLGLEPACQDYRFNAAAPAEDPIECSIACAPTCSDCGVCCPGCTPAGDAEGTVYRSLAQGTGGIFQDWCAGNFVSYFQDWASAYLAAETIPCQYTIPAQSPGPIPSDRLDVTVVPGSGQLPFNLSQVDNASLCAGQGWYPDDPAVPAVVNLCPDSCGLVQADPSTQIQLASLCP